MFLSRELLHCGLITPGRSLSGIHTLNILFLKLGDVEREPPLPLTHLRAKKMPELVNHNSSPSFFSLHCAVYSFLWFCSQARARFHSIKRTFFSDVTTLVITDSPNYTYNAPESARCLRLLPVYDGLYVSDPLRQALQAGCQTLTRANLRLLVHISIWEAAAS